MKKLLFISAVLGTLVYGQKNNQSSQLSILMESADPGTISFYKKISCESTGSISEKLSVTKLLTVNVPIESLSICRPCVLIACRWVPLATKVTS